MTASSADVLEGPLTATEGTLAVRIEGEPWASPSMRYCTTCGERCATNAACVRCTTPRLTQNTKSLPRNVTPAIALYFLLLGLLLACTGFEFTPLVDLITCGLMTVIVGCFAIAMRGELKHAMAHAAWQWCIAAVFLAPFTYAIASGVVHALDSILAVPKLEYAGMYRGMGVGWPVMILVICLQPAVVEELAFRGIIFAALQRVMGPVETIIVSALMFMTLHLSPVNAPHLFVTGVALGYLRYRSKSILPGVALHFAHNFLSIVI